MKDKKVGIYLLASIIVFIIAAICGGTSEYADGIIKFLFILSTLGVYTFGIWGLVKLLKSNN